MAPPARERERGVRGRAGGCGGNGGCREKMGNVGGKMKGKKNPGEGEVLYLKSQIFSCSLAALGFISDSGSTAQLRNSLFPNLPGVK